MLRRREPRQPWTHAEGVRDVLGVLLRRVPLAVGAWALLLLGLRAYVGLLTDIGGDPDRASDVVGRAVGRRRPFNLGVLGAFALGLGIGWVLARELIDRVHFTGWIPRSMAIAAALAAILSAHLLLAPWLPTAATGYFLALDIIGFLMASLMIAFLTWGE